MARRKITIISILTMAVVGAVAFNNCSETKFSLTESMKISTFNSSGGIVINNGDEFAQSENVVLALSHESAKEMYVTNDSTCQGGGSWEPFAKTKLWNLGKLNSNSEVFAKFREGKGDNIQGNCLSDSIIHDNIPPVTTLTKKPNAFINKTDASLEFGTTDSGSGVKEVLCATDAGASVSCSVKHVYSGLIEGTHSTKITATDRAGNASLPTVSSFVVDLTPPVAMFTSGPSAITNQKSSEFVFSGSDKLSGIDKYECKFDQDVVWEPCESSLARPLAGPAKVMTEGSHNLSIRVYDKAGNISPEVMHNWKIDVSAPTVKITKGPEPYTNVTSAKFEFEGVDGTVPITSFTCSIDNATPVACTSPYSSAPGLVQGPHDFSVVGIDAAGNNSAPAVYRWVIDTTPPTVTITQNPAKNSNSKDANFEFNATDTSSGVDKIECQIDGGGYTLCVSPKTLNLPEGDHTFEVRAKDKAGNTSTPAVYTWKIDLTLPTVNITSGPAPWVNVTGATLVFVGSDGNGSGIVKYECALDSSTYTACTSPAPFVDLTEEGHLFLVRAVDAAGNISDPKSHSWSIDMTPPAISFQKTPAASMSNYSSPAVQYAVVDMGVGIQSVTCGLNDVLVSCTDAGNHSWTNQAIGSYKFTVVAEDKLGNKTSKDVLWSVTDMTILKTQTLTINSYGNKIDFLVIIDNSGSMAYEQNNMAARFGTFLDQLAGLDWQVAIVTTDLTTSIYRNGRRVSVVDSPLRDGRFVEFSGMAGTYILNSNMPTADAKAAFAATIQRSETGSGNEQGIAATYRAIQRSLAPTNLVNAPNVAFWRPGAAFGALVVTDADETNKNGTEIQNTPAGLIDLVRTSLPGKAFTYNSIIVKPDDTQACKDGSSNNLNEGEGFSYAELSSQTGGVIGSVCESDYGSLLTNIGRRTADLVRSAILECEPLDTNSDGVKDVEITNNDSNPGQTYVVEGTKITFGRYLPIGTTTLKYTCLK